MKKEISNLHVLSFRVNADEKKALLEQAQRQGLNITQLLRKQLIELRRS